MKRFSVGNIPEITTIPVHTITIKTAVLRLICVNLTMHNSISTITAHNTILIMLNNYTSSLPNRLRKSVRVPSFYETDNGYDTNTSSPYIDIACTIGIFIPRHSSCHFHSNF